MHTVEVQQALDLPLSERGLALLEAREDQWFERKSGRITPRELADCLIGFANAEGGTIVLGLHKGNVEGIDRSDRLNAWTQAGMDFADPPVRYSKERVACINGSGDPDHLLVIRVEPSPVIHANQKDEVFLRVGDENRKLTFRQRQELLFDKGQAAFEASPLSDVGQDEVDDDLLRSYVDAVRSSDADRLLAARGLTTPRGEITVAACLLFCRHPQARFPEAFVRVLRFRGVDRGTGSRQQLEREVRCEGPIPVQLRTARDEVKALQPSRRALGPEGRFVQVSLIPEDAWLEGIVNGVVHRSYSLGGDHIRVEIFDDRIEIESPGRFPGLANIEDPLEVVRFARNPRIAKVCGDLAIGQELGEGIKRMFEEMRIAGLSDPLYDQTSGSVRLTLSAIPVDRKLEERLPAGSRSLVRAIREAGRLSTGDAADVLGVSRPVAIRRLRRLEEEGLIKWVGKAKTDPRAHWELV